MGAYGLQYPLLFWCSRLRCPLLTCWLLSEMKWSKDEWSPEWFEVSAWCDSRWSSCQCVCVCVYIAAGINRGKQNWKLELLLKGWEEKKRQMRERKKEQAKQRIETRVYRTAPDWCIYADIEKTLFRFVLEKKPHLGNLTCWVSTRCIQIIY